MKNELEIIKELRNKTLERIIEKHGAIPGSDFKENKLSIWDVREILYKEAEEIAQRFFDEEFKKWQTQKQ